jgi:cysteinyl-tRNA synthetase
MIENINAVMKKLRVDDPDVWLKATQNIGNIIKFIAALVEKGHAYRAPSGDVYFDVRSFPAYGQLSNRNVDDALDGVRIDNGDEKKNAYDFALWKSAKEGEICWNSPWGKGRPGWHIECSAMNRAAFGDQIDIHGGGRDLIFPHHENEIAQTEALTGKQFVKYWTHNGLIKVNGQKMSKSLGNSLLLADLLKKYSAETIKFALLQTNYRNDINITDDLFPEAAKHILEFYTVLSQIDDEVQKLAQNQIGLHMDKVQQATAYADKVETEFNSCMSDDFNTALALSNLFGYFKEIKKLLSTGAKEDVFVALTFALQIRQTYSLLGFFGANANEYLEKYGEKGEEIPEEVKKLADERFAARQNKDWATSDILREKLAALGYTVKDSKTDYELIKNG